MVLKCMRMVLFLICHHSARHTTERSATEGSATISRLPGLTVKHRQFAADDHMNGRNRDMLGQVSTNWLILPTLGCSSQMLPMRDPLVGPPLMSNFLWQRQITRT